MEHAQKHAVGGIYMVPMRDFNSISSFFTRFVQDRDAPSWIRSALLSCISASCQGERCKDFYIVFTLHTHFFLKTSKDVQKILRLEKRRNKNKC